MFRAGFDTKFRGRSQKPPAVVVAAAAVVLMVMVVEEGGGLELRLREGVTMIYRVV